MEHFKAWINAISQKPLGYKAAYLCMISLFMIAVFYFFIGNSQSIKLEQLNYETKKLNEKIYEIQSLLVRPEALYHQINQLKIIEKKLEQRYKIDFNFLSLLHALSQIDKDLGLTFLAIDPGEQSALAYYSTFTMHISVIGNFHQLILYLSKLFNLNFLMTIDELHITPIVEDQDINYSHVSENIPIALEITVLVYRFE